MNRKADAALAAWVKVGACVPRYWDETFIDNNSEVAVLDVLVG